MSNDHHLSLPASVTAANELTLANAICFRLYAASNLMTRAYRPHLDALGLSYPQLLVLLALWQRDGRSVTDLGETLMLDSGTLSPVIKRLQAAGFVTKTRDDVDERRVEVCLTAAGRDAYTAAQQVGDALRCKIDLDLGSTGALIKTLDRLIANMAR